MASGDVAVPHQRLVSIYPPVSASEPYDGPGVDFTARLTGGEILAGIASDAFDEMGMIGAAVRGADGVCFYYTTCEKLIITFAKREVDEVVVGELGPAAGLHDDFVAVVHLRAPGGLYHPVHETKFALRAGDTLGDSDGEAPAGGAESDPAGGAEPDPGGEAAPAVDGGGDRAGPVPGEEVDEVGAGTEATEATGANAGAALCKVEGGFITLIDLLQAAACTLVDARAYGSRVISTEQLVGGYLYVLSQEVAD